MRLTSLLLSLCLLLGTALASLESWEDSYLFDAIAAARHPRRARRALGAPTAPVAPASGSRRMVKRALPGGPRRERRMAAGFVSEELDAKELPSYVTGGPAERLRSAQLSHDLSN